MIPEGITNDYQSPGEDAIEILETFGCTDAADALRAIEAEVDVNQSALEAEFAPKYQPKPKLMIVKRRINPPWVRIVKLAGRMAAMYIGEILTNKDIAMIIEEERQGNTWSSSASNIINRAVHLVRKGGMVIRCLRGEGYQRTW